MVCEDSPNKASRGASKMETHPSWSHSISSVLVGNEPIRSSLETPTRFRLTRKPRRFRCNHALFKILVVIAFTTLGSVVQGQPREPPRKQPESTGREPGEASLEITSGRGRATDRGVDGETEREDDRETTTAEVKRKPNEPIDNNRVPNEIEDPVVTTPSEKKTPEPAPPPKPQTQIWSGKTPPNSSSNAPPNAPTSRPSDSPTDTPTDKPSTSPITNAPSSNPSISPTSSKPSDSPSTLPTKAPIETGAPSDNPTTTQSPSGIPTEAPSESRAPSPTPTSSPTEEAVPSLSPSPTIEAREPSLNPSAWPSYFPSDLPTPVSWPPPSDEDVSASSGTAEPTGQPSGEPTTKPTHGPTKRPSVEPTVSAYPSSAPIPCPDDTFGPFCVPAPIITSVTPDSAFKGGGTVIQVDGINIKFSGRESVYGCYFSVAGHVHASLNTDGMVECVAPSVYVQPPNVQSTLIIFVDGVPSSNEFSISFENGCQGKPCGSGYCSFGRCVCLPGFRGEACEEELLGPEIVAPTSTLEIIENKNFEYTMVVSGGTSPIEWSIVGEIPGGLSINAASGKLAWSNPKASTEPIQVLVKAHNMVSFTLAEVSYVVLPSYSVRVSTSSYSLSYPSPQISFEIETRDVFSQKPVGGKVAHLWIRQENGPIRKVETTTNSSGYAKIEYLPYSGDKGTFVYGGMHPSHSDPSAQGKFIIRAIDVSPSHYLVSVNTNEKIILDDVFKFAFGGGAFYGLSVHVEGSERLWETLKLQTSLSQTSGGPLFDVSLSLTVESTWAVSEVLKMTLVSDEGDSIRFDLVVDIRERSPAFKVTPSFLDIYIPRSGLAVYRDVTIENVGAAASGKIEIAYPDSPILTSLSGGGISELEPDEKLVTSFVFEGNDSLEVDSYLYGTIIFKSNDISELLHYRATAVSTVDSTLTIIAQNEATCFSDGKPHVSGAEVQVKRPSDGSSWSASTDDNGIAIFENLEEGVYEINVRKQKHRQFRTSVSMSAPGKTVQAFLQANVVSNTFTIVPIDGTDDFLIDVKSKVDTFVPKPAVVWDPPRPDWEGILAGKISEIQISATNHGPVAAENVSISWPRQWEDVEFLFSGADRSQEDGMFHLGSLPPNSTYTFTITTKRLELFEASPGRIARSVPNGVFLEPAQMNLNEGFSIIFVPFDDPKGGRSYIQYNDQSLVEYIYDDSTSRLFTFAYNGAEVVDVKITENMAFPDVTPEKTPLPSDTTDVESGQSDPVVGESPLPTVTGLPRRKNSLQCARQLVQQSICALPGVELAFCEREKEGNVLFAGFYYYRCGSSRKETHDFTGQTRQISPRLNFPNYNLLGCTVASDGQDHATDLSSEITEDAAYSFNEHITQENINEDSGCRVRRESQGRRLDEATPAPASLLSTNRELEGAQQLCSHSDVNAVHQAVKSNLELFLGTESRLQRCIDEAHSGRKQNIFLCVMSESVSILPLIHSVGQVLECQLETLADRQDYANVRFEATRFKTLVDLLLVPYGGTLINGHGYETSAIPTDLIRNQHFNLVLTEGTADDSADGRAFSFQEIQEISSIAQGVPDMAEITKFTQIWNKSLLLWIQGVHRASDLPREYAGDFLDIPRASETLAIFESARKNVKKDGFQGLADAWATALKEDRIEEAKGLSEVCASVSLWVDHETILAGTAFETQLEISNPGLAPMESLSFALHVNPMGDQSRSARDLFLVQETTLHQVSDLDGTGALGGETVGYISWLLVPLKEAAPSIATAYDIGGVLTYSIEGVEYEQKLLSPATITVTPEGQVRLVYFRSRIVGGDVPSTPLIEPSVPFQLGVLVENKSPSEVTNVGIQSPRPEILTSEDLQSSFTVIKSMVGSKISSDSLAVDFGVIPGRKSVAAVWDMVSPLWGKFADYSAILKFNGKFEGDSLSLIQAAETHELLHVVRVMGEHPAIPDGKAFYDDGVGDFLVNRVEDADFLPDTVFTSDGRQSNFAVDQVINKALWTQPSWNAVDDTYEVVIQHNLPVVVSTDWVYIRFNDPLAGTGYVLQSATRSDFSYTLFPEFNTWQTSQVDRLEDGSTTSLDHIHLFDCGVAPEYVLLYTRQHRVSNLHVTATTQHSLEVAWHGPPGATAYYVVFRPALLSDEYSKAASTFTMDTSLTIPHLTPGTDFKVSVYAGNQQVFERTGASVIGSTLGSPRCANGKVEWDGGCIKRMIDNVGSALEPTNSPVAIPPSTTEPAVPAPEPIESCPEEDICSTSGATRYWISKYTTTGVCRPRCVRDKKIDRMEGFVCGQTCGGPAPPTPAYVAEPSPSPIKPVETEAGICPVEDKCTSGLSQISGYFMSYIVGKTCSNRCMRESLVPMAIAKGYVCGRNCAGIVGNDESEEQRPNRGRGGVRENEKGQTNIFSFPRD